MIRRTDTRPSTQQLPSSSATPSGKKNKQSKTTPHSAADVGRYSTASGPRVDAYKAKGVNPFPPPGMPTPRDRDSEKIVYQSESTLHAVADNPPLPSSRFREPRPFSPAEIGMNVTGSRNRSSVYDSLNVDAHLPPGMPSPRDRDSEKIVYQSEPTLHAVADNPPLRSTQAQTRTPHSADVIGQGVTASGKRTSVYDSLNVAPHLPPGVPSARDRDSEKIVYQSEPTLHAVSDNPPLRSTQARTRTPHSADAIGQGLTASGKRTSVYDSLNVAPHQPPGMPSARDRNSEKIVYQSESTLHAVADNPPMSPSRFSNTRPFSPADIGAHLTASGNRTSVYDSLNVRAHQPPGMPSARDRDSEKIVSNNPASARANNATHTSRRYRAELEANPTIAQADSRPIYEAPGSPGGVELPTSRDRR